MVSTNPANGKINCETDSWSSAQLDAVVGQVYEARKDWSALTINERISYIVHTGEILGERRDEMAQLITGEIGKVLTESYAEIDKCIFTCEYYAENAKDFLVDEIVNSDASNSYLTFQPLGTILGIMPWNFPFWQVFRFVVPALITGNTVLLKHASSVSSSALMCEKLFFDADLPENVFRCLLNHSSQIESLYSDERISGIALTGSEKSGRQVAQKAGSNLKKVVLELGGSDAFVVLDDAEINLAVKAAVTSRFFTSGQSCINAKRIVLTPSIAEEFTEKFLKAVRELVIGDPMNMDTRVGPMARLDLRNKLHQQVKASIDAGAIPLTGCSVREGNGFYYLPSILDHVKPGLPAYDEEIFGPVASLIHAESEQDAIRIANDTRYGLGSSIWTRDVEHSKSLACQIEAGMVYINGIVKSDPRLAFGGVKNSGIGRELGRHGMLEFANVKTVWIA